MRVHRDDFIFETYTIYTLDGSMHEEGWYCWSKAAASETWWLLEDQNGERGLDFYDKHFIFSSRKVEL